MLGIIVTAITTAFSNIFSSGVEKVAKLATRVIMFTIFLGFVSMVIDFIVSKITSYSLSGLDPCTLYFISVVGLFPALGIYLQVLSIGLIAKYAIRYLQDSL